MTTTPAQILDITAAEYHADPCERPSLSHSIANELLTRSPLHAWNAHPRLGKGVQRESSAAMATGTLIHALLLGRGEDEIAVLDVDDFRKKDAREERDAAIDAGKTVIRRADYDEAGAVVEVLRERMIDLGVDLANERGRSEVPIAWEQDTPEGRIWCRSLLDRLFLDPPSGVIYDLKTIRSADLRTLQRHIIDYGYDVQGAAYVSAVEHLNPRVCGRVDFVLVACEVDPPYAVTPVRLSGSFARRGELSWEYACRTWARCLRERHWPAYVERIESIEPPAWAMTDLVLQGVPHGANL